MEFCQICSHYNDCLYPANTVTSWIQNIFFRSEPLVLDPVKTAETLGFEKPSFVYLRTDDPIQKDTILLNYCIGDIEKFKGEIEAAKSGYAKTDFQATDFVGIFQKFKLSFNILVS